MEALEKDPHATLDFKKDTSDTGNYILLYIIIHNVLYSVRTEKYYFKINLFIFFNNYYNLVYRLVSSFVLWKSSIDI